MSVASPVSALPSVRLEVSQGGRSVPYRFDQVDFLIGAVAGCDLRVPGAVQEKHLRRGQAAQAEPVGMAGDEAEDSGEVGAGPLRKCYS